MRIELPSVYRLHADRNANLLDNVKEVLQLMQAALHMLQGEFVKDTIEGAKNLSIVEHSSFRSSNHSGEEGTPDKSGLDEKKVIEPHVQWVQDNHPSADAIIRESRAKVMSWALLDTLYPRVG